MIFVLKSGSSSRKNIVNAGHNLPTSNHSHAKSLPSYINLPKDVALRKKLKSLKKSSANVHHAVNVFLASQNEKKLLNVVNPNLNVATLPFSNEAHKRDDMNLVNQKDVLILITICGINAKSLAAVLVTLFTSPILAT
jgi:hypothetical protein